MKVLGTHALLCAIDFSVQPHQEECRQRVALESLLIVQTVSDKNVSSAKTRHPKESNTGLIFQKRNSKDDPKLLNVPKKIAPQNSKSLKKSVKIVFWLSLP
eukprot:2058920-Amphidinium_carterae.1